MNGAEIFFVVNCFFAYYRKNFKFFYAKFTINILNHVFLSSEKSRFQPSKRARFDALQNHLINIDHRSSSLSFQRNKVHWNVSRLFTKMQEDKVKVGVWFIQWYNG